MNSAYFLFLFCQHKKTQQLGSSKESKPPSTHPHAPNVKNNPPFPVNIHPYLSLLNAQMKKKNEDRRMKIHDGANDVQA